MAADVLANPRVDGVALRHGWDQIEKADGKYDWSYLDRQVAAAVKARKKVSLSVSAGNATPDWVYAAGAKSFTFKEGKAAHQIPVPWDPVFLAKWQRFIRALGGRYADQSAVVLVKITGINSTTPETMLPADPPDLKNWVKAGYTQRKVEDAWVKMADAFAKSFPQSRVALVVVAQGLPAIDDQGKPVPGVPAKVAVIDDLIERGSSRLGNQLAVENHALSDYWVSPQVQGVAKKHVTGYQLLWFLTGDESGRIIGRKAAFGPEAVLKRVLARGADAGARYVEVYQRDVLNPKLQDELRAAQTRLR